MSTRAPFACFVTGTDTGIGKTHASATLLHAPLSAGWLFPGDPLDMATEPLLWPGRDAAYPLGSDMLGRDIAAGLFHGARASLLIAAVATTISVALGVAGGVAAGFYGGRVDCVFGAVTTFFQTIPSFLFALAIVAIAQPSVTKIALAIGITSWPALARLVRARCCACGTATWCWPARHLAPAMPTSLSMTSCRTPSRRCSCQRR